jgi:hypothetical protein
MNIYNSNEIIGFTGPIFDVYLINATSIPIHIDYYNQRQNDKDDTLNMSDMLQHSYLGTEKPSIEKSYR